MGSISKNVAAASVRIVIGNDEREVKSLREARGFLREHRAGALADFIMSDLDPASPVALVAFRNKLEMVRAAL
ncbi:MAG: hypothetical protein B7X99_07785 [Rhizobiales bacterium 17-65-6]|nr:MAG: hypothetical protein B7Z30_17745 [Rhizobiales bacterium 12-68-15]OYY12268.1 MAG: hypothetical protein B7Y70_06010 [Rhizobiales bacterium 35-68-8]OYZ99499.1 MAG: hypothetical protein B7X99_07785 [Rhizobiales bacterium 17-65-6]